MSALLIWLYMQKQGWRLIKKENSLYARVFRAKFLPNSFMEANLGVKKILILHGVVSMM